jgi:hypothetical protein
MSDYDCITQHSPGSEPGPSEPGSGSSEQLAVFTNGEYMARSGSIRGFSLHAHLWPQRTPTTDQLTAVTCRLRKNKTGQINYGVTVGLVADLIVARTRLTDDGRAVEFDCAGLFRPLRPLTGPVIC